MNRTSFDYFRKAARLGVFTALFVAGTVIADGSAIAAEVKAPDGVEKRLEAQDARLKALEDKFDKLIGLLADSPLLKGGAQVPAAPAAAKPAAQGAASASVPAKSAEAMPKLKPGIWLDVYMYDSNRSFEGFVKAPKGASLSRKKWKSEPILNKGVLRRDQNLKRLAEADGKEVGLYLNGMIEIKTAGPHVFVINVENKNWENEYCGSSFVLDGEVVITTKILSGSGSLSESAQVDLPVGIYDFGIWQHCGNTRADSQYVWQYYPGLTTFVAMKGPNDTSLAPVSKNIIGHLE